MNCKTNIKINQIVFVLMILLFCSFTILESFSWGRYIMLGCLVAIFIFNVIQNGAKYNLVFGRYFITIALFALYTLASAVWAEYAPDAVSKSKTLFEMLFMIFILYNYFYSDVNSVQDILSVIKWSSFFVVIYSILYYGMDNLIILAMAEERLDNSYANVNTIGMLAAIGTLVQIDEILTIKKFKWPLLLCIPSVFLIAMTQSRKAFVILIVGVAMEVFFKTVHSKDLRKTIIKTLIYIVAAIVLLNIVLSLPVFSGVMERMDGMIAMFTGHGEVDRSSEIRNRMVALGFEQFLKTPLFGMGMGNPHFLAARSIGKDSYLHNNFIELLAGGGLVGFLIYYSMYIYLFANMWKYRKCQNKEYVICLIMMLLLFVMDYGMVSYYSKTRYIYLMLYFLEVEQLKKRAQTIGLEGEAK